MASQADIQARRAAQNATVGDVSSKVASELAIAGDGPGGKRDLELGDQTPRWWFDDFATAEATKNTQTAMRRSASPEPVASVREASPTSRLEEAPAPRTRTDERVADRDEQQDMEILVPDSVRSGLGDAADVARGGAPAEQPAEAAPSDDGQAIEETPLIDQPIVGQVPQGNPRARSKRSNAYRSERMSEIGSMSREDAIREIMSDRRQMLAPFVKPAVEEDEDAGELEAEDNGTGFWSRLFGYATGKRTPRLFEASTKRGKKARDREKRRAKNLFDSKDIGRHVYAKLIGSASIGFREVGVGIEEIVAVIEQNPSYLGRLMAEYAEEGEDVGDIASWSRAQIIDFFRNHDVYVSTFKPPDNTGSDMQRRILRIVDSADRGIYIHPIMAAMYTADYDGDDMKISLDPRDADFARDPMSYMLDYDGEMKLDMKWLPIAELCDGWEEGKSAYEYIRDYMLADIVARLNLGDAGIRKRFSDFAQMIIELGKTANQGEDEQKKAYSKVFRAARDFADWYANSSGDPQFADTANSLMSDIVYHVYQGMRNLRINHTLTTAANGGIAIELPADMLPEPRSHGDQAIWTLVDGMVRGALPNNFQELRVMLNAYLGITGKYNENGEFEYDSVNAPFRFSADIGKLMKIDTRLQIGGVAGRTVEKTDPVTGETYEVFEPGQYSENGDFVINMNDDDKMAILFESLVKYQQSERMAKEIKKAGKVEYQSERLRQLVKAEAKFPWSEVTRRDGTVGVRSYSEWLEDFVAAYRKHSAIINQSYLSWLANMEMSSESNERVVSPLNRFIEEKKVKDENGKMKTVKIPTYRFSDLAEPILTVYGSHSVEKMFFHLVDNGNMRPENRDPYWLGNPKRKKSGSPHFFDKELNESNDTSMLWVTGKYMTYSLRAFAHENRLVQMDDKKIAKYRSTTIEDSKEQLDDVQASFHMLMAIADKSTGTASKFNKLVFTMRTDDGRNNGIADGQKATIQMWSDLGAELKDLSMQGTVIQAGYYAGIGSRETPANVRAAMTRIGEKLAKSGYRLRSGHATGADQAFEKGAGDKSDIFLPFKDFESSVKIKGESYVLDKMSKDAQRIAEQSFYRFHPGAIGIVERSRSKDKDTKEKAEDQIKFHKRNHFQIEGLDGAPDSAFVACWSPHDDKTHGTDQAIRIANAKGIPVFNAADYMKDSNDMEGLAKWEADVIEASMKAQAGELKRYQSRDQMLWVDDIVETLVESGPELFAYFNMDSSAGFLNSKWGKQIVDAAGDLEKLGSIRTAMVFEYRMRYVRKAQETIGEVDADEEKAINEAIRENENLKFALDKLADSSETWHGIISEFKAEDSESQVSYFQAMRDGLESGEKPKKTAPDGLVYDWTPETLDADLLFWKNKNGPNPNTHRTLMEVIEDPDIPRDTKWRIIRDVVSYWESDPYLKNYEIGFQMEIGNDAAYMIDGAERIGAMKAHNDFREAFTRWGRTSRINMRNEIRLASVKHRQNTGALMQTLQRLDSCPWELIAIDNAMYASAILSVKDKTYAQTEKASQHPWTNAIYAAVSFQRNGGFMNDVTRTDDRFFGLQSVDAVDLADVIHILADPTAELWVYNKYGELGYINRAVLLSTALGRDINENNLGESDIWEFLEKEPRIASAIRRHNACVRADVDGTGYIGATNSISETIQNSNKSIQDPLDHVKYLMRDHPVYAGIISLASKSPTIKDENGDERRVGSVTRNERSRVVDIEDYLCRQLYTAASSAGDGSQLAEGVLESMGITREALRESLRSDYNRFLSELEIPKVQGEKAIEESQTDADVIYDTARKHIDGYISEIRRNVRISPLPFEPSYGEKPSNMGVDVVSAASFWDVIQELGGAKTSVSTGIEGAETYNYGNWAAHMDIRDRYADLAYVADRDDIDQSWDGAWTNLVSGGETIPLVVDETGNASITYQGVSYGMDELKDLIDAYNENVEDDSDRIDEIVVMVPEGYLVHDKSTDSFGNPLTSLAMFMVSKRSNGAETFNLKAKKAGYDGTDSIIKMQGRHRMVNTRDENGNQVTRRVNFLDDFRNKYALMATNGNVEAARLGLAKELMKENQDLGYSDLTLSNYMCLAELMLIQGDNGVYYIRSLEMLFSAVKHRIGEQIDDMTEDQIRAKVAEIIYDTSETGVGIGMMATQEAFNEIKPKSTSHSTTGINLGSSNFARNYDLMDAISKSDRAQSIVYMADNEADEWDRTLRSVDRIGNFLKNLDVTRRYRVIGYMTTKADRKKLDQKGFRRAKWQIGPRNLFVIDGSSEYTAEQIKETCDKAYDLGVTVAISHENLSKLPAEYFADAMISSPDGDAIIPMFDIRLNGSEAKPSNGGSFSIFQTPYDRYTVTVEDSINFFELGDAQYKPLKWLADRIRLREHGSVKIKALDLFPNSIDNERFDHHSFSVHRADANDIKRIVSGNCVIDYGVVESDEKRFKQRKRDVEKARARYAGMLKDADKDLQITQDFRPGDIVSWIRLDATDNNTGKVYHVYAPIIPFPLHGSRLNVPSRFRNLPRPGSTTSMVQLVRVAGDNNLFAFDWENTSTIERGFAKFFDSSGGANKGMVNFADTLNEDLMLSDGTRIDMFCAKASTDSRKIGTDRRIKTMISLMAIARMHGYNFAADPNDITKPNDRTFPDNPELRNRMLHERIPTGEWKQMLDSGDILFLDDYRLNKFINYECRKILENGGNPWDFLANKYTEADGTERDTHVMWEFEAMFDQGLDYEHDLLRFFHHIDPMLCPDGIYDDNELYTFRLARNQDGSLADGYDAGVLQMLTPYKHKGKTLWIRNNVYVGLSFFGEEYSGFSRPNIDGSSVFLDAANTAAYYGKQLDDPRSRIRNEWATSDIGRIGLNSGGFGPYNMRNVDVPDDYNADVPDDEQE